jgi:hypothetical protein
VNGERWTDDQAREWHAVQPWLIGCNFIPSTAVNQLEMWQADTFDLATIERELGWARDIGFNSIRVFLHDLLWEQDRDGFLDRVDRFLDVASRSGISTMLVIFDGVWDPHPTPGAQRAPRPGVHNSGWVQSPGAEILGDVSRRDSLKNYVSGVIDRFRDDDRILAWDLFNEPNNPNLAYATREINDKTERAIALLRKAFDWARGAGPSQPLTAGIFWGPARGEGVSEINRLMLSESDVISFHSYFPVEQVEKSIRDLQEFHRPILLTEFLSRGSGSTFEAVLPLLKKEKVGAYCWGLVSGKTQTIYPWDSWTKTYTAEPDPWFHDVLRPDGTPYRDEEVALIRRMSGA